MNLEQAKAEALEALTTLSPPDWIPNEEKLANLRKEWRRVGYTADHIAKNDECYRGRRVLFNSAKERAVQELRDCKPTLWHMRRLYWSWYRRYWRVTEDDYCALSLAWAEAAQILREKTECTKYRVTQSYLTARLSACSPSHSAAPASP